MNGNSPKLRKIRQKYSVQFKGQALERAEREGVPQTAKDLGITESLLYSWKAKQNEGVIHSKIKSLIKLRCRD